MPKCNLGDGSPVLNAVEFEELFAARATALRRTAYLLCGDWHRAEDLTQTAFAKVYAAWSRLRDKGAVDAYLRQTLMRVYLDEYRRSWRRERPTAEVPDVIAIPGDPIDDRLLLLTALATVPPRQRACLVLRYFEDYSIEQTADALGCSAGTVKSNTARGLDALRASLGDVLPELTLTGKDIS
jgi:RNA polymerase sigma-70 factor (sigma-E family)